MAGRLSLNDGSVGSSIALLALLGTLSGALAGAPLEAASGCGDARNLLAGRNCDFQSDVAGWWPSGGETVSHDDADGHPAPGALAAAGDDGGSAVLNGPCVEVGGEVELAASGWLRTRSGTPYFCGATLYQYTDGACSEGQEPLLAAAGPPRPEWTEVREVGRTLATSHSAQIQLVCSGEPGFVVLYDDLYFGPP